MQNSNSGNRPARIKLFSWLNNGHHLEKAGFLIAVISFLFSTYFACVSVKLQRAANDNTATVDTLKNISVHQVQQLDSIGKLLKNQSEFLDKVSELLKGVNKQSQELFTQTGIMLSQSIDASDQLKLNRIELKKSNYSDKLVRLAYRNRLAVRLRQTIRLIPTAYPPTEALDKRIAIVKGMVELLIQETDNVFLMENTSLFEAWDNFRRRTESNLAMLTLNPKMPLDGKIISMNQGEAIEVTLNKYWTRFTNDYGDFELFFRKNFFNVYNIKY